MTTLTINRSELKRDREIREIIALPRNPQAKKKYERVQRPLNVKKAAKKFDKKNFFLKCPKIICQPINYKITFTRDIN